MDQIPSIDASSLAELRRRSDLYDKIRAIVGQSGMTPVSVRRQHPVLHASYDRRAPRIEVRGRAVICNGHTLELARRPMTLRLFRGFCGAPGLELSREEVISIIYGADTAVGQEASDPTLRSARLTESLYANTVKLISRARILATTYLGHGTSHELDWLVYNQERQSWQLYQMRASASSVSLDG